MNKSCPEFEVRDKHFNEICDDIYKSHSYVHSCQSICIHYSHISTFVASVASVIILYENIHPLESLKIGR
jgi:hypothetical protein